MQIILLNPARDSNYVDLIEFCAARGIELVEEKFTSTNSKSMPCSHETYNDITSKVHVCSECHKVFWE